MYRVLSSSRFPGVKSYYCSKRLLGCVSVVCREKYPPATLITHPYLENTNSESWCYIHRERLCRSRVHSWAHSGQDVLVKISYFYQHINKVIAQNEVGSKIFQEWAIFLKFKELSILLDL